MLEKKLKNRRSFTPEFKLRVVVQIVSGQKTLAEASREYQVKDTVLQRWRDHFLESGALVFGSAPQGQERIAELERVIGQLHLEVEVLKKASGQLR